MARMGDKIGLGAAEAMIVQTQRNGQLKGAPGDEQKGLGDASDDIVSVVDRLTGGTLSGLQMQVAELKSYLQISIAASVVAGGLALLQFLDSRRRD
jgi:hypothetical protein